MLDVSLSYLFGSNLIVLLLLLLVFFSLRGMHQKMHEQSQRLIEDLALNKSQSDSLINNSFSNQERHLFDVALNTSQQIQNGISNQLEQRLKTQNDQLKLFQDQLHNFSQLNESKIESMRKTLDASLSRLQEENNKRLEEIRATVDEKLQSTLEKRLTESFKSVTDMLETVHKGSGEMRNLASQVGDLNKVLNNVKTRGIWGEAQLDAILQQMMAPDQYASNVAVKEHSQDRVEYAIKLPGNEDNKPIWLPMDAKFPLEDYQRLLDAQERGDHQELEKQQKALESSLKKSAKTISEKYVNPPLTTDFAIMFLPIEGLYAEALRIKGMLELMRRDYRVVIAGPTTLSAILSALLMGFKAAAIEKHSSEVWRVLEAIKPQFENFGALLSKTKKKLDEASNTIGDAETRTRVIQKQLNKAGNVTLGQASIESQLFLED